MFLLTKNFIKNSHIYAKILRIFQKTNLNQTRNAFNKTFSPYTISERICETKFSFDVKELTMGKV